jgi:hypothetical protein
MFPSAKLIIQFIHKALIAVFGSTALFPGFKQMSKSGNLLFIVFKHTQASPYDLACRGVAAFGYLAGNKVIKMLAKGYTGVFGHFNALNINKWYLMVQIHNMGVNQTPKATLALKKCANIDFIAILPAA